MRNKCSENVRPPHKLQRMRVSKHWKPPLPAPFSFPLFLSLSTQPPSSPTTFSTFPLSIFCCRVLEKGEPIDEMKGNSDEVSRSTIKTTSINTIPFLYHLHHRLLYQLLVPPSSTLAGTPFLHIKSSSVEFTQVAGR